MAYQSAAIIVASERYKRKICEAVDRQFSDEDFCRWFLQESRWPERVACPRCHHRRVYKLAKPFYWQCPHCNGYRFSVLVGTPFEDTRTSLRNWFLVVQVEISSNLYNSETVTAAELHQMLEVGSYRTTKRLRRQVQKALRDRSFLNLMGIDEFGGLRWLAGAPPLNPGSAIFDRKKRAATRAALEQEMSGKPTRT
ncbi:MAG TPA: transposase [Pseudolabrys sp.]|nr:transposase [Pseudolabrys sp.]